MACSSRTRSSLTCSAVDMSPTSSSSRVPPCAAAKRPARRATAPVKAPRSWPNSSASSSVSGKAAQFTATKRFAVARAAIVERAGDQLLAGARLAEQQDGRVARRDRVEAVHHPTHDGRAADDLLRLVQARELHARLAQLALNRHLGRDPLDAQRDVFAGERLPEVVVGAFPDGRDGVVNLGERGHQDHDRGRRPFSHQPEQRQAIELRQPDVGQQDVDLSATS